MHLTRYSDYSLRVLIYLGARSDRLVTIQEIAEAYGVSRNHLMKVVHHLGTLGYLQTVPGRRGGLRLGRDPATVNIGQLVADVEADMCLVECFDSERNSCPIAGVCGLQGVLGEALAAFMRVLGAYTLADLLDNRRVLLNRLVRGPQAAQP